MTIFLTILKVIGIILLVILGLILLIRALELFTPISYRLSANHNEEDTSAKAKIGFLIVRGIVEYNKAAGLDYAVKLLCFKIYPGKEKPDELEDYEEGDALDMYDEADGRDVACRLAVLWVLSGGKGSRGGGREG